MVFLIVTVLVSCDSDVFLNYTFVFAPGILDSTSKYHYQLYSVKLLWDIDVLLSLICFLRFYIFSMEVVTPVNYHWTQPSGILFMYIAPC